MSPEKGFLDAIHREPDEPAHRLVYADWLDEQGDARRAEFLRLEVRRRRGDDDRAILARLRELLPEIGADWAAFLDRAAISYCRYGRTCPGRWEGLELTVKARVRLCAVCGRFVQHTRNPAEVAEQIDQGHPVAVDSRLEVVPIFP